MSGHSREGHGPVIIGFDGSQPATYAVTTAASLLAPAPAVIVVVWEADLGFELVDYSPAFPVTPSDTRGALEIDQSIYEMAQRLAETGAEVARQGGLDAEALAMAEDGTVADTLLRLAGERHARAIVVGTHGRRNPLHEPTGSTARAVVKSAPCPVVLIRYPR
ncbi:MAG: universal stress protein [Acidimicrobiales bacterium]|jgi:nucleotide-binding universal stress UspA family protein